MAQEKDFDNLKFHVPTWQQFDDVFIAEEQRKSSTKALFKYISGEIGQVGWCTAEWALL